MQAAKLVIGNTTVQNNEISPPILSVVYVVTLVIWLKIVQIDSAAPIGVTIRQEQCPAARPAELVEEMLLTANTK